MYVLSWDVTTCSKSTPIDIDISLKQIYGM